MRREMYDLDKARAVLGEVLATDAASRGESVVDGAACQCWEVFGPGWRATLSTMWDIMACVRDTPGLEPGDRWALLRRHVIEVHAEGVDGPVMGMSYGEDGTDDHLYRFEHGDWEDAFRNGIAARHADISLSRRASRVPTSGLRSTSPSPRPRPRLRTIPTSVPVPPSL